MTTVNYTPNSKSDFQELKQALTTGEVVERFCKPYLVRTYSTLDLSAYHSYVFELEHCDAGQPI